MVCIKTNVGELVFVSDVSLSFFTAKQKLEDRLAAAAREKLAQASKESKERQLQAERKRKAALFLQTLRGPEAKRPEETPPEVCAVKSLGSLFFICIKLVLLAHFRIVENPPKTE